MEAKEDEGLLKINAKQETRKKRKERKEKM
jgi:hypothetical protein